MAKIPAQNNRPIVPKSNTFVLRFFASFEQLPFLNDQKRGLRRARICFIEFGLKIDLSLTNHFGENYHAPPFSKRNWGGIFKSPKLYRSFKVPSIFFAYESQVQRCKGRKGKDAETKFISSSAESAVLKAVLASDNFTHLISNFIRSLFS